MHAKLDVYWISHQNRVWYPIYVQATFSMLPENTTYTGSRMVYATAYKPSSTIIAATAVLSIITFGNSPLAQGQLVRPRWWRQWGRSANREVVPRPGLFLMAGVEGTLVKYWNSTLPQRLLKIWPHTAHTDAQIMRKECGQFPTRYGVFLKLSGFRLCFFRRR